MLKEALQPARVALAAAAMNWPDHDVALLSCAGSDIVRQAQQSFIFRAANVTAETTLNELISSAGPYMDKIVVSRQPKPEQVREIWKNPQKK